MLLTCTSYDVDLLFPICKTGSAALDPARRVVFPLGLPPKDLRPRPSTWVRLGTCQVAVVEITTLPSRSFPLTLGGNGLAAQLWAPVIPRASIVALTTPLAMAASQAA